MFISLMKLTIEFICTLFLSRLYRTFDFHKIFHISCRNGFLKHDSKVRKVKKKKSKGNIKLQLNQEFSYLLVSILLK
jgi:hypothetical protein